MLHFCADIERLFLRPIDCVIRLEVHVIFRVELFSQVKFVRDMHRKSENARSLFLCEVTDCATRKSSIRVELFSQVKLVRDVHRKRKHTLSIFCYRSRIAWQGEFLFLHQVIASRDLWRIKAEVDFLDIHSRTTQEEGRIYVIEQLRILDDVVAANACLRFGKRYWS